MKAIQALRAAGRMEEALVKAQELLQSKPNDIWSKRAISWVYYDYLKSHNCSKDLPDFLIYLEKIKNLALPAEETMLYDQLGWQIGKMGFNLLKEKTTGLDEYLSLFRLFREFSFTRLAESYSFLLKPFHKGFKNSPIYLELIDWWGLESFIPVDYQKGKLPNGKDIMAFAEQVYIAYAKQLLIGYENEPCVGIERIETFLILLDKLIRNNPHYEYPPYFKAKLLLAIGDRNKMLETLLPFARRKQQVFWVWDLLGEAFAGDEDKILTCYCKALGCKSPEEMLINLRQRMAGLLIHKELRDEACTEIRLLVKARNAKGYPLPPEVRDWMGQKWFEEAPKNSDNHSFYSRYRAAADQLLYEDLSEQMVIVVAVQPEKENIEFIASESCFGFFSYSGIIKNPKEGQVLKVRFHAEPKGARYTVFTARSIEDLSFRSKWIREVEGEIKIQKGKSYGFVKDVYIPPLLVSKLELYNGRKVAGEAIKTYQADKKQWGWKLVWIK